MKHPLPIIVFPEAPDAPGEALGRNRIVTAGAELIADSVCHPVFIGDAAKIQVQLPNTDAYTVVPIDDTFKNVVDQGATLVANGVADAMVAGATHESGKVIVAAAKIVGMQAGTPLLSSCFMMSRDDTQLFFTDCAVVPNPDVDQLVSSAYLTSQFAAAMGVAPRVAFISYATYDSAGGPDVDLVQAATEQFKVAHPDIPADGPLQYDVARSPQKARKKLPDGAVIQGDANILVFPSLETGNAMYKAVEIEGSYQAVGPLLLGAQKPVHDLSRGCSVADVVAVATIAAKQVRMA